MEDLDKQGITVEGDVSGYDYTRNYTLDANNTVTLSDFTINPDNYDVNVNITMADGSTLNCTNNFYLYSEEDWSTVSLIMGEGCTVTVGDYMFIGDEEYLTFGSGSSIKVSGTFEYYIDGLTITLSDAEKNGIGSSIIHHTLVTAKSFYPGSYVDLQDMDELNNAGYTNVGNQDASYVWQEKQYGLVKGKDASGNETLTFHVTPEPATATLSLLALAGLAARRRRH